MALTNRRGDAVAVRAPTSRTDPSGLHRAEAFWNSRRHGLATVGVGQFQLSFPAPPRWIPRSSGQVRNPRRHPLVSATCEEKYWDSGGKREIRASLERGGQPGCPLARGTHTISNVFVLRMHDGTDSGHFEGMVPMKGGEKRASVEGRLCCP